MRCPYCAETVHDDAIVCPHCHRDFSPMKPLMKSLEALTARVEALEQAKPASPSQTDPSVQTQTGADDGPSYSLKPVVVSIVLLLVGHFLTVVQLDLSLVWLRSVSIAVPLVCGFIFRRTAKHSLVLDFLAGLGIAAVSIPAMLWIVSRVDGVPILPQNVAGWREVADYGVSITLAFFAGALIRQSVLLGRESDAEGKGALGALIRALLRDVAGISDRKALDQHVKSLEAILTTAFAVMVALGSLVTGIGRFLR
jgi:hypothetical protein